MKFYNFQWFLVSNVYGSYVAIWIMYEFTGIKISASIVWSL